MKHNLKLWLSLPILLAVLLCSACEAHGLTGSWRGELNLGQMKLPLVFNFSEADGQSQCTMDSPAQGAKGIATQVLFCSADSVSVSCQAIGATYSGRITPGVIKGNFSQRGYQFPLDLTPETSVEERRPQTPRSPFPYEVKDTVFTAPDGAVMAATLTLPRQASSAKIPAVVMVTGSGPQNRDEELFEHKPFAVIADYLARNGIASLRYDDRGTGKSGGDFGTSTTYTFKDDALGGIDFLRTIGCIGPVGVLGHSEGGTIAFMTGAEGKADFIISLAGMALSGKETVMSQNRHSLDNSALSEAEKAASLRLIELVFDTIIEQEKAGTSAPVDAEAIAAANALQVPAQILQSLKDTQGIRSPWYIAFLTLNPREYLGKVKCSLLAINGDKDTQVSTDNLKVIEEYVPGAETRIMPGLNHLMQHAVTGEVSEYGEIKETISPEVLEIITQFINSACK